LLNNLSNVYFSLQIRAANESIRSNMAQYNLVSKYLDAVIADASLPLWRSDLKLDAIITDRNYCFDSSFVCSSAIYEIHR
jgi:tRNA G10  N-methylase Trm11